jgi:lipopolysaccharide export system protein LptA
LGFKKLIIFIVLLIFATTLNAQSVVNILFSERVQAVQTEDGLIRKLSGKVHLKTNDLEVRSDSAWHFVDKAEIHGFGNLRIDTETETIWADKIIYDIEAEISSLSGNVIIETSTSTIYSQTALYSFLSELALFNNPIWLQDNEGIIKASSGVYFNQADSVVFRGNVQIADSTQYIEADSIFTNRSTGIYKLYGEVYLFDEENKTAIKGDYVEADSTGKRIVDGNAILRRLNSSETDTTWLFSDRIDMTKVDTFYVIDAISNVRSWQKETSTFSDSLNFNEQTELFKLRSNPKVWYKDIQLSGQIIDVQLQKDSLKSLFATSQPFATQQDSLTFRLNQMKGDSITIYFRDDNVDFVHTENNAEILLHYTDDEDQPDGAINIRSTSIFIYFEDGEVSNIKATTDIDGETYPENQNLSDIRLDGFSWNPELRPDKPINNINPRFPEISLDPPFVRPNARLGLRRESKNQNSTIP